MMMRNSMATLVGFTALAGAAQASHIQTTTLATGRSAGIRTDSAAPLEEGRWSFGVNFENSDSDRLSQEEMLALREEDPEASLHSIEAIRSLSLDASYGLTRDITVGIHLPYVIRYDILEAAHEHEDIASAGLAADGPAIAAALPGIEELGKSAGIGDMTVYGLWRFYEDPASDTNLGLIAGVKTPTGTDDQVADTGEVFEAEFQPGSGSWDPFAGIAWGRSLGAFSLAASTVYTLATEGSYDTDLGDQWTYNASAGYRLGNLEDTNWSLVLELNGGWRDREEVDGAADANSGGSWLYVSPGVNVTGHRWSIYASLGLPVDKSLNGNQDDLGYRFLLGMQYLH